jgi:hypothetical protein
MENTLEFIVMDEKGKLNEKKVIGSVLDYPHIIDNLKLQIQSPIIERGQYHEYTSILKIFPHFYKELTKFKK